jgi:regulatory protein
VTLAVPASRAARLGLSAGVEADPAFVREFAEASQKAAIEDDMARYLAGAERTSSRLRSYLKRRRFLPTLVEEAVERASRLGWVDDSRYASMTVRSRPGRGRARLIADLVARGVSRETAAAAATGIDEDVELDSLLPLIARRYSGLEKETALRRATGFLVRRGFQAGKAWRAARKALGAGKDGDS